MAGGVSAGVAAMAGRRVAYLSVDPGVPVFGSKGASVHVQEIVRSWRNRGAEVTIYCTRSGTDVPPDLADVPVVVHPIKAATGGNRERAQVRAAESLAAQVIRDGADAVYERYSLFSDALQRVTEALRIPGFLEVNAPLIDEQRKYREIHDEEAALDCLRGQVRAASTVACVSAPVRDWVLDRTGPGARHVIVTPNGVNGHRIRPSPETAGRPVVVFVGTLKPWHGVRTLLEAQAAASRAWALKIVGDGPEGPALRALAADLELDVEFTGAVPPDDIPAALAGCAIGVAPYPALDDDAEHYFSPLKIYEYCAAGLPVVASRVGQVPGIIEHGVTGLLVDPSNAGRLAGAIDSLVEAPGTRAAMSAAARRVVLERHSWDSVLARITEGAAL